MKKLIILLIVIICLSLLVCGATFEATQDLTKLEKRSSTQIGNSFTIHGRLIVNGEDTMKEKFPNPCCYPLTEKTSINNPKNCTCAYSMKTTK